MSTTEGRKTDSQTVNVTAVINKLPTRPWPGAKRGCCGGGLKEDPTWFNIWVRIPEIGFTVSHAPSLPAGWRKMISIPALVTANRKLEHKYRPTRRLRLWPRIRASDRPTDIQR